MRTLLPALLLLLQDPVVSGRFETPKGWTRQELESKSVALQPPGDDARKCTVLLLPTQEVDLEPEAAHDRLFQQAIQGSAVEGGIRNSVHAGWRASQAKVVTAQQQELWTAVYTLKTGKRLEAVMIVASTEALFKAHQPAVEKMIGGAAAPAAEKPAPGGGAIHGLVIPVPATWTRKDDPSGTVLLIPPQIDGVRQYLLTVLPPSRLEGTRWEAHKAILKGILAQVKWTDEPVTVHSPDAPGPFIRSSVAGKVAGGGLQQLELYTAAHDGVTEAVLGVNGIDRNVVEPVLRATTLKDPPRPPDRPRIVEAYRRLEQKATVNREGGALTPGSLIYERIWLRSDGVADFSTSYPEGYAASPLVFKVDPSLADGTFGTWKAEGDRVLIVRRAGSPAEVYDREDGGLRHGGRSWEPMPRVDGMKLSGRWGARSGPEQKVAPWSYWVEFTPEGTFGTDGALSHVAAGDADRPKPPVRGAGTYEIRDWTMFFTFADGKTWSTDFSILGRDPQAFTSILFRTTALPRDK